MATRHSPPPERKSKVTEGVGESTLPEFLRWARLVPSYRHAGLLTSLSLLILVRPFLVEQLLELMLLDLFLVVTLLTCIFVCATHRLQVATGTLDLGRCLGFSLVTLTTLGYGNVLPVTPRAEALATTEAIVGQSYLTVLVARLVAMQLTQSREDGPSA